MLKLEKLFRKKALLLLLFILFIIYPKYIYANNKISFFAYKENIKIAKYNTECLLCTKPYNDPNIIVFTNLWKVVLVPNQANLGRVVIVPQRFFSSYEEMTDEEAEEYRAILKILLPALKKTFNVTLFNVAYLMNNAFNTKNPEPKFKNGKPNPMFHWNIYPRYDGKRVFENVEFTDPEFGSPLSHRRKKQYTSREWMITAINSIRSHLKNIHYIKMINRA